MNKAILLFDVIEGTLNKEVIFGLLTSFLICQCSNKEKQLQSF